MTRGLPRKAEGECASTTVSSTSEPTGSSEEHRRRAPLLAMPWDSARREVGVAGRAAKKQGHSASYDPSFQRCFRITGGGDDRGRRPKK